MTTAPSTAAMRLQPHAEPLLPLGGRALLDHAIDRLEAAGVTDVLVGVDKATAPVRSHLAARRPPPNVVLGAGKDALGRPSPCFVVDGDTFWVDGPHQALRRMAEAFDAATVDGVLLVHRTFQVHAEVGFGDFAVDKLGLLRRRGEREIVPYVYAGVQLIASSLLDDAFGTDAAWDRAIEAGRLRAVVHDGLWFRISTTAEIEEAEAFLREGATGETR